MNPRSSHRRLSGTWGRARNRAFATEARTGLRGTMIALAPPVNRKPFGKGKSKEK